MSHICTSPYLDLLVFRRCEVCPAFRMFEAAAANATVKMQFRARGLPADEQLAVQINGHEVMANTIRRTHDKDGLGPREGRPCGPFYLHEFPLKRQWLKPGHNLLSVRLEQGSAQASKEIIVWDVEMIVSVTKSRVGFR